jgi:hypothetical protein
MKFLVISKPNGTSHGLEAGTASALSKQIKGFVESPTNGLEAAYAMISGGSAIVINAADTKELAKMVRSNPLFKSSSTEIIPIADAHDFIAAFAK